jgi:hypothetical protein
MEWKPYKKQELALISSAFETLYGGARGGGKSDAGIMWLLYDIDNPKYRALVIRRNATDLNDWIARAKEKYEAIGAVYIGNEFRFPFGATIVTGHLKDDKAFTKYQGHEYHRMLIEELTQIPSEGLYMKLISSCRSTVDGLKAQVFATTNPDGVGRHWVKKRFITGHEPMVQFKDEISGRTRVFIPATVEDNPAIMTKDPDYVKFLDSLEPDLRAQWRYGSWDYTLIKGAIYGGEMIQANQEGRIGLYPVSTYHQVHILFDIGLNDLMVAWFFQVIDNEVRFVDLLFDHNKQWSYYAQEIRLRGYEIGIIFTPHDGTRRSGDTLKSFNDELRAHRFTVETIPRPKSKQVVIDRTKTVFPKTTFDITRCETGITSLESYRRIYDEARAIYSDEPEHDEHSHFADSFGLIQPALEHLKSLTPKPKRSLTPEQYKQFNSKQRPTTLSGAF